MTLLRWIIFVLLCYFLANIHSDGLRSEGAGHDYDIANRVDRTNVEPNCGLHENLSRLQALLCRAHGTQTSGHGDSRL